MRVEESGNIKLPPTEGMTSSFFWILGYDGLYKWRHLTYSWTFGIRDTDVREGMVVITIVLSTWIYNIALLYFFKRMFFIEMSNEAIFLANHLEC